MGTSEQGAGGAAPYVACDKDDAGYFGARDVIKAEESYIRAHRGLEDGAALDRLTGLALSGGGIRSASFALGVMQALAYRGWLKKIDYLSTVSGGGYIGSSLTWILENDPQFATGRTTFPYASYPISGESRTDEEREPLSNRLKTSSARFRGRMLRFLRQNAKYLTPGKGINMFSIVAVALRGSLAGLLAYGGLLMLLFTAFSALGLFEAVRDYPFIPCALKQNRFLAAMYTGLLAFAATIPLYAAGTYVLSRWFQQLAYPLRRGYERFAGCFLPLLLGLAVLGGVPYAYHSIIGLGTRPPAPHEHFKLSGQRTPEGAYAFTGEIISAPSPAPDAIVEGTAPCANKKAETPLAVFFENAEAEMKAMGAGFLALLLGFASAAGAFMKTGRIKTTRLPLGLFVTIGVIALLFGLFIFAYSLARLTMHAPASLLVVCALLLAAFVFANINHLSLHRFYRDRLMETFLPNVNEVLEGRYERAHRSNRANTMPLHAMCARPRKTPQEPRRGPYHIVNTNVVLVSSENAKYRGRGGDSFILSPAYCGSNATGWRSTADYMGGSMTLASAMAISGAALNPSAGCGGEGITRSPFLSILMGVLNFRLGYWAPNPRERTDWRGVRVPNSLLPGLCEVAFRNQLDERSLFVQLSDGGHFENLGLYELLRRKLELILVCDGGADPKFSFSDLANAVEKARTDFGALVMIESEDLDSLIPREEKDGGSLPVRCARQPYLIAKIKYADNTAGRLIYLTTTFFKQLSADLYGYKKEHPAFPDEPTSDQFFDEKQFEAYRELGFQAAWAMMGDGHIVNDDVVKKIMPVS